MRLRRKKELPLVSVLTPAYNAGRFLKETLSSVLNQDYGNVEHIVVNDGSNDDTEEILKEFRSNRNLHWITQANRGLAEAVNRAVQIASGEFLIWLNADDLFVHNGVVRQAVSKFLLQEVDIVYGHMCIIDENSRILNIQYAPPSLDSRTLSIGHFAACIFYRKEVFERYKLDPHMRFGVDYDQCLRMAVGRCKFGFIDHPLIAWRRHPHSLSVANRSDMLRERSVLSSRFQSSRRGRTALRQMLVYSYIAVRKCLGFLDLYFILNGRGNSNPPSNLRAMSLFHFLLNTMLPYT
jgi:glycosyltransferase involved in cell wall biosynthesis